MMRQHEGWCVVRRISAPPALPLIVRPFAPDRTEHIPAQDEGAEAFHRSSRELVIGAGFASGLALHLAKAAGREKPLKELRAAFAEGVIQTLFDPRRETIH